MLSINKIITMIISCLLMITLAGTTAMAQTTQPTWWFGISGAANFNFYDGTTQRLNNNLIVPQAFHKGNGVRPYASVMAEYRPKGMWGAIFNIGYDGLGSKFKGVIAPCDCPATLKTNVSYLTFEPSLRLAVSDLYFFAGPSLSLNVKKDFSYTQLKQPNTDAELSNVHKTRISGQVGVGYEIPLSSATSTTKFNLSPFVSFHPYFGRAPRDIESWQITTLRAGVALKFGKASKVAAKEEAAPAEIVNNFEFTVQAPSVIPSSRQISETLPLRNSVFFDEASAEIPARYIQLNQTEAASFKEEQLQTEQSASMTGRSARQLNVYYNILNILGDRLRSNPGSAITLSGASGKGPVEGKSFAEAIKHYLAATFGISDSRIITEGRNKPLIPSEQPGGTKELVVLRAGDRRVDVLSTSPELLTEVGGEIMKPVHITSTQVDPLAGQVILKVDRARDLLKSWSVNITDKSGKVQHYGPFTNDQESLSGQRILGTNSEGDYKVVMTGETKIGLPVTRESTVHLVRQNNAPVNGLRYSILFDFDKSYSIAAYTKFLTDVVSMSITEGSTVSIQGHTDLTGDQDHNMKLSQERAAEVQTILAQALSKRGINNVKFDTTGFGEDISRAPFENETPEEHFYNRTVIIDIIPVK